MDWEEKIKKWLMEGKDRSEKLVDLPWDVEAEKLEGNLMIKATHPSVPFSLSVSITKHFTKLGIVTDIETDFVPQTERLKIYKILLVMNGESNLLKIGLSGVESRIVIYVDLDLASLNKEEFNDALSAVLMGAYGVYSNLGLNEKLNEQAVKKITLMAYQKLEEEKDSDSVIEYLSMRVGLQREQAEELVKNILETKRESRGEDEDLRYIV